MSKESILKMLEAHGTFPNEEFVLSGFEELFNLSRENKETVDDIAWGFLKSLDQWSHVVAAIEPELAKRLRDWTLSNWATKPYDRFVNLCAILVNLSSPEVITFLKEQAAQSANADIKRHINKSVADILEV